MNCFLQRLFRKKVMNTSPPPPLPVGCDMMQKVREDVARLLNHAVKQPSITVKTEFLQKIVPLLCRNDKDLSPVDHVELWNAYNHLSILLAPVTADSLETDEKLNGGRYGKSGKHNQESGVFWLVFWMFVFVFTVFCTQSYSIILSNNTKTLNSLISIYTQKVGEETTTRNGASDKKGKEDEEPLLSILNEKKDLEIQLLSAAKKQCTLIYIYSSECATAAQLVTPAQPKTSSDQNIPNTAKAILQFGNDIELWLNGLVLPLLLGFLGATAFLTRNILNHLNDYTFTPAWGGRYIMRVLLGGLLGVMGPWLYSAGKLEEVGLGLLLFAFLLGYSVELAFTLFDKFINYVRDAVRPGDEKAKKDSVAASVIADSPDKPAEAPTVQASGTAQADAVTLEQNVQEHRKRLREIIELEPVLQVATPPDYFKAEIAPKIQTARDLLQQLDAARENAQSDVVALTKALAAIAEFSKAIIGKNHPLAVILRNAMLSFGAALVIDDGNGNDGSRSETLIITLFAGAVAAFVQGASTYERWLAYVWAQPFTARLIGGITLSEQDALECLKMTDIFQRVFKGQSDVLAKKLLELAARTETSEQLAELIWQSPDLLSGLAGDLPTLFGSVEVFTEAWVEYRHCLVRYVLQKMDFPANRFNDDNALLTVAETLAAIDTLRQNTTSEKDLDILCYLSLELMQQAQTSSSFDAVELIKRTLAGNAL